jgi:hypothetical protein
VFGWLDEIWTKRTPNMSKLEKPNFPWFNIKEVTLRLRKIGMLERICHLRPTHPHWEHLEGSRRPKFHWYFEKFVRRVPAYVKGFMNTL